MKQAFDDLIGDPPESRIDVSALVRRERRRHAVMRTGLVVVAVVAVAATVPLAHALRGADVPSPSAGAPPVGTARQAPGFRLVTDDRASAQATAKALTTVLDEAVHTADPGARWLRQNLFGNPAPDGEPPRLDGNDNVPRADEPIHGGSGIGVGEDRGTLVLQIMSTRPCADPVNPKCVQERDDPDQEQQARDRLMFTCLSTVRDCATATGPRGEPMLIQTVRQPASSGGPPAFAFHEARSRLPDGRVLSIQVSNEFLDRHARAVATQDDPPLNRAQVQAIATFVSARIRA